PHESKANKYLSIVEFLNVRANSVHATYRARYQDFSVFSLPMPRLIAWWRIPHISITCCAPEAPACLSWFHPKEFPNLCKLGGRADLGPVSSSTSRSNRPFRCSGISRSRHLNR